MLGSVSLLQFVLLVLPDSSRLTLPGPDTRFCFSQGVTCSLSAARGKRSSAQDSLESVVSWDSLSWDRWFQHEPSRCC